MHVLDKKKLALSYGLNFFLFIVTLPFRLFRKNRKANLSSPKILVSRPDHIGDLTLSTPVYHSLKEKFPSSRIVLLCGSWGEPVVKHNPYIDEIWIIDCPWWSGIRKDGLSKTESFFQTYKRCLKKIKAMEFDLFIELRGDIRHTFLFGWIPNIPMRLGNNRSGGEFLMTHAERYEFEPHEIEKNYQVLRSLEPLTKYYKTEVFTKPENSSFFARYPIRPRYAVLFNGGRSPLRHLPASTMLEVVRQLHARFGLQSVMVGSKEDKPTADSTRNEIQDESQFLSFCGDISLLEVKELISRAALFIGTDSSVSHIVASTLTPAISLYGPMLPGQVQPLGDEKKTIYHRFPCSPCLQTQCVVNQSWTEGACMKEIAASEVLKLAAEFLGEAPAIAGRC